MRINTPAASGRPRERLLGMDGERGSLDQSTRKNRPKTGENRQETLDTPSDNPAINSSAQVIPPETQGRFATGKPDYREFVPARHVSLWKGLVIYGRVARSDEHSPGFTVPWRQP